MMRVIYRLKMKFSSPKQRAKMLKIDCIGGGIKLGEGCEVYDRVSFGSEPYLIKIGDNVRITAGVNFITHDGGMWVLRNNGMIKDADAFGRIIVGNNVHIGINAIIMPGVTIGDNVVIGVGAVVTKDIPSNCIVAGVPARIVRSLDEYHEKYKDRVDYTKAMSVDNKKKYLRDKYNING